MLVVRTEWQYLPGLMRAQGVLQIRARAVDITEATECARTKYLMPGWGEGWGGM